MDKVIMSCAIRFVKWEKTWPIITPYRYFDRGNYESWPILTLIFDFFTGVIMGHYFSFQGVTSGKYLHQNLETE